MRYFNAKSMLPPELLAAVMRHIPDMERGSVYLFIREDYYSRRNAEIIALFRIYQDDPHFGSAVEIYEALAEQFGLTPRHICRILEGKRPATFQRGRRMRRLSGMRVTRSSGARRS